MVVRPWTVCDAESKDTHCTAEPSRRSESKDTESKDTHRTAGPSRLSEQRGEASGEW
jgi:hypothetical protein